MTRIKFILLSTLLFYGCCSTDNKEFNFDDNEPKHLSCYKAGDTIYFENSVADIDTITILSVDSTKGEKCFGLIAPKPTGKSCWVTIKHLPNDKWHRLTTSARGSGTDSIDYQTLIHISKDPVENKTFFWFCFKDFTSGIETILGNPNTDTLTLNKVKITNYYFIKHHYPERVKDSTNIETIIWTDKDGLTAYKNNKKGDWWTKK